MPAATEVQFEAVKDPGGAGNVAGQLAEALFEQGLAHQGVPCMDSTVPQARCTRHAIVN
ncbi:hypothetical protein D3C85_1927310 [compost metagenome]